MDRRRLLFLGLATPLAAGCATYGSVSDGTQIKPEEGLLAFHMDSAVAGRLSYVRFERERSFSGLFREEMLGPQGLFAVDHGEAFSVNPLRADEYMWTRLTGYPIAFVLHTSNRFVVKPNTISYIGHLRFRLEQRRLVIGVTDREPEMLKHLRDNFPKHAAALPFEKNIAQFRVGGS
jgi:hypothetical protein